MHLCKGIVDLDDRDSDLDETGDPAFFVNCADLLRDTSHCAFTDLLFDKDSPYMGGSSEWPSPFSLPSLMEGTRPKILMSLSPMTAMKIQCPPKAKHTVFGVASVHHGQMVNKSIILKLGECVWLIPAGHPSHGYAHSPEASLKGSYFKHSFKLILTLVQGRYMNR